jgi:histone H3/H4
MEATNEPATMPAAMPVANVPNVANVKRRRWKNGTVAKREIRKLQKSTDFLIPREPFKRLVREIAAEYSADGRFAANSMVALQEAAESFLVERFQRADLARRFAGRQTLDTKDLQYTAYQDQLMPGQDC